MTFYAMERRACSEDRRRQQLTYLGDDRRRRDRRHTTVHAFIWREQRRGR